MSTLGTQRDFLDPRVLARLSALPLFARRPMQGHVSGRHPSTNRGSSVEFAEYRNYAAGDDPRRIDWRTYGRTDRFFVKEFEADTNLRCCVVLDTSGSMGFGSKSITKLQYGRQIAAALSYLTVQQGDAVGLTCAAEGITAQYPPRRHQGHLRRLFDALQHTEPAGPTRLTHVLHELAETVRQRALIVVISDLLVAPSELRSCLEHLRFRRHDLAAFHVLDPQEVDFQLHRPTRFLDLEGGPQILAQPEEIADRYRAAVQEYLQQLRQVMLATATDYQLARIDQPYDQVLARFLVGRGASRGIR